MANRKTYTNLSFSAFHVRGASGKNPYRVVAARYGCPPPGIFIYSEPFSVMNRDADLLSSVKLVSTIERPDNVFAIYIPLTEASLCVELTVYQTNNFAYPIIITGSMWSSWSGVAQMLSTFEKNMTTNEMLQLQKHTFKLEKTSKEDDVALVAAVCTSSVRVPLEIPSIDSYYRRRLEEMAGKTYVVTHTKGENRCQVQ